MTGPLAMNAQDKRTEREREKRMLSSDYDVRLS